MDALEYVAIGPYAWGKGSTIEQAQNRMKKNVPSYVKAGYGYVVYETHGNCEVSEIDGGLSYPKDQPAPTVVEDRRRK